jgi:hypothetical protein
VASRGELAEPAVEAGWWAVALDGGVWAAAVSRAVFRLRVSASPADTTAFIFSGPGVCIGIVGQ